MVLSNLNTQYTSLSVGIAQEPVSMTSRAQAATTRDKSGAAQTICVTVDGTVRGGLRTSAVDSTIELVCTGVAHKARAALSGLSGQRHGRWCRVHAPSSGRRRVRPIFLNLM